MAVEKIDIDQTNNREGWLALRRDVVSASEVALLLGCGNPHREINSLAALYADKKGLRPPRPDNAVMRRGRRKEKNLFEEIAETRPHWDIVYPARIYLVDKSRHIGATPDGFALRPDKPGRGVIEGKTVARSIFRSQWLLSPDDDLVHGAAEVPPYYRLQCLTTMMLSDSAWGVLAVLITGEYNDEFRLFDIKRDAELEERIVDRAAAFWDNHMIPAIRPDYDPQRDAQLIRAMYPQAAGTVIDLSTNNMVSELVDIWQRFATDRRSAEADEDAAKATLQMLLGEHSYGVLPDGRVLQWKNEPKKEHWTKASNARVLRLRRDLPRGIQQPPKEGTDERTAAQ